MTDEPIRAQIDDRISLRKLAQALATQGMVVRANLESSGLYITIEEERCHHGVIVPEGKQTWDVCDDCNESRAMVVNQGQLENA